MRFVAVHCGLAAVVVLTGCAKARVTTSVHPDGSWTRNVALIGQAQKQGQMTQGQMTSTIEDTFVIPSGGEWKSSEEKNKEERTLSLERVLAAGATLAGAVSVKEDPSGKLKLVNRVTVTRAGPRRFEYRETLHWTADRSKALGKIKPEDLAKIKGDLPPALATDANAAALAERTTELSIPLLFGPGDPLLAMGLMHPDLAVRRAGQRMGSLMVRALEEQFGDKLTPIQRRDVARKMIQETFSMANSTSKIGPPDPSADQSATKSSGFVPLIFIVKAPGRVVSSNGEVDELTGEVFWGLFPEAAGFKDVVLTAVLEVE